MKFSESNSQGQILDPHLHYQIC